MLGRRGWRVSVYKCDGSATLYFFFQAEDGIRDLIVTGVQTCALPILPMGSRSTMLTLIDRDPIGIVLLTKLAVREVIDRSPNLLFEGARAETIENDRQDRKSVV